MTAPDNDDHAPPPSREPAATDEERSVFVPPVSQWSVPDADEPDEVEFAEPDAPLAEPSAAGLDGAEPNGTEPDRGAAASANGLVTGGALEEESVEPEALAELAGPRPRGADAWPTDEALEAVELDDEGWTRRSLEAILLVADEPVPASTLAELVGARLTQVESMLIDLAGEYAGQGRGFVLRAVAGGWRLYTHPATRDVVEAYLRTGQQSRLTRAALETLAVIAYRQPVTRHQVAAVRGVNVDGVFRTLASRGLIHEVGHEEGPGQAALYGTTPAFLEQLGLNSLDQLPPIKDYLPEGVDLMELLEQM
jgi:segregation and condensation protein B